MWSIRLNLPMICSAAADDEGDAPERRGAYGFDGVAMMAALAGQPGASFSQYVRGVQLPTKMRVQGCRQIVTHGLASV
jgi:hypothetical protein